MGKGLNQQKRNPSDLFIKGENFLRRLKPADKIVLIYHMDLDGLCSAALIHRGLKKLNAGREKLKVSKSIVSTYKEVDSVFESLEGFNKVIIVDIAVDQKIENDRKILLIDHHIVKKDMSSDSIVFINPRLENPETYQPASYVVYKLFSKLVDMKDVEWISALGIVGDWGYEDCRDVVDNWVKVKNKNELFHTKMGQVGDLLLGASYEIGFDEILDILLKAKSIENLQENKRLLDAYKKYDTAFKDGKKEFWENAETFGSIIFSVIKPKYRRLSSPIINRVSFENPNKVIFIFEEESNEKYKVSARYQRASINLGEIMKKCCGGGGHKAAAGGSIKIENLENFKALILKELHGKL